MSTYQTDEEQVEAIKRWWKENGKSVIGGIVLRFAVIGGWQGWQGYQRNQGEAASMISTPCVRRSGLGSRTRRSTTASA